MPLPNELMLTPCSLWFHVKTRSLYTVLGIALCSTNGEREHSERSVVYFSHTHGGLRYREVSEFLDGRFKPVGSFEVVNEGSPTKFEPVKEG